MLLAKIQIEGYVHKLLFANLVKLQCPVIWQNANLGVAMKGHFVYVTEVHDQLTLNRGKYLK